MISFVCPGCSQPLDIQNKVAQCPHCGHALPLNSPATEALEVDHANPPAFPVGTANSVLQKPTATRA